MKNRVNPNVAPEVTFWLVRSVYFVTDKSLRVLALMGY